MKLVVSQKSDKPIYEQIYGQIAAAVLSGAILPHTMLPSIRGVAAELGISVITVKNAYELLERDGFIYTQAGKGCFVCPLDKSALEKKRTDEAREKLSAAIKFARELGCSAEEVKRILDELI